MNSRDKAISYLAEGHGLLKKHGLYGKSDDIHTFAIDRALANFAADQTKWDVPYVSKEPPPLCFEGASEAAAALQALYEAKRLVTARSSIEGRRIILGDWFMSLAVALALPLRSARLADLMSEELSAIGTDANSIHRSVSQKSFYETIDRFTTELTTRQKGDGSIRGTDLLIDLSIKRSVPLIEPSPFCLKNQTQGTSHSVLSLFPADNKLLSAIGSGFHKTAAIRTRNALSRMETWFSDRYASEAANETDGWIYGAIMSGGKRLRPMLVRLCAGLGTEYDEQTVICIMSTIELMHSASLVHDDIVDRSPMRRSRATINAEKGDGYAAMCGFIMIADALSLIGTETSDKLIRILSGIPMKMCGGELHQLDIENMPEFQSEHEYFDRIACKTAALIEGSCVCGAISCGADDKTVRALSDYGRALGLLFQLRDDLFDYGVPHTSGKPVSQDMERGIYSLPLLYAMDALKETDAKEYEKLDAILRKHIKEPSDFRYLNKIAEDTGGISYTLDKIEEQAKSALSSLVSLPQDTWTEALSLIVFALTEGYSRETYFADKNARLNNE